MTRIATPEEIATIRSYPTAEEADDDARVQEEGRKKKREEVAA